jgi:hypothetical protein
LLAAGALIQLGLTPGAADPTVSDARLGDARTVAQHWLAEIDAGKLDSSYEEGCLAFQKKVSKQQWVTVLQALRPTIGTMTSRHEIKYQYKPDGFEGLDGEIILLMYDTVFSKLGETEEIVELKREDGQWRGAGYNVQPQAQAQPQTAPSPQ